VCHFLVEVMNSWILLFPCSPRTVNIEVRVDVPSHKTKGSQITDHQMKDSHPGEYPTYTRFDGKKKLTLSLKPLNFVVANAI
jgi:hypothetical protein